MTVHPVINQFKSQFTIVLFYLEQDHDNHHHLGWKAMQFFVDYSLYFTVLKKILTVR